MGAVAQNLELLYFQGLYKPILYADKVLDHSHDGLLSVSEATTNKETAKYSSRFG